MIKSEIFILVNRRRSLSLNFAGLRRQARLFRKKLKETKRKRKDSFYNKHINVTYTNSIKYHLQPKLAYFFSLDSANLIHHLGVKRN